MPVAQFPGAASGINLSGDSLRLDDPQSPRLEGSDPVERAPVLWVADGRVSLDGYLVSGEELEEMLRTAASNYRLFHPYGSFSGNIDVLCSARVDTRSLAGYLKAVRVARYRHPTFVFTRRQDQVRPILGKLSRVFATGARATLADEEDDDGDAAEAPESEVLRLDAFETYGDLARRSVELRRAGSEVSLVL